MAYFDFALYKSGEIIALKEKSDLREIKIEHSDILPDRTYWII